VSTEFAGLARSTMKSIGFADMAFVEVEHPMGMISTKEILAKTDKAFPQIIKMATNWQPSAAAATSGLKPAYPAERVKFKGDYEALNKMFYSKKWSIGLPIIPPTPEAVAAMLKGTKRDPSEVVWTVPPKMGRLTVELVAAIGVMAGAKPEHMPVLLAVVKALSHPDFDWRGSSTTTAPTVPLVIINGPILKELGIGYSAGAFGGEMPVNTAIGYFINLVGDIVGGSMPPDPDKSSLGSSGDLVALVTGENEELNPWKQSYAVEHGFQPTDSVVTTFSAYLGTNNTDHTSVNGQQLLNTISLGVTGVACGITSCFADYDKPYALSNKVKYAFLLLGPEHADTIYASFPTKQAVKDYVIQKAVAPFWMYAPDVCKPPESLGPYTPDTLMPRFAKPESIHIVVTGGPGKQSQIWVPFPTGVRPVSVKVEK
jgi:hypothetical protein